MKFTRVHAVITAGFFSLAPLWHIDIPQQQHISSSSINYTVLTKEQCCNVDSYVSSTDNNTIIYCYCTNNGTLYYDEEIQSEIYNQYNSFNGELPNYELVLALWIRESNLNPKARNKNSDGTYDIGIPQLNSVTLKECERLGWYNPKEDNLTDYKVQIALGLKVLSYYTVQCRDEDISQQYQRCIRAYKLGLSGLRIEERKGNYGQNDEEVLCNDGCVYRGDYGQVKKIESGLMPCKLI